MHPQVDLTRVLTVGTTGSSSKWALPMQFLWFLSQKGFSVMTETTFAVKLAVTCQETVADVDLCLPFLRPYSSAQLVRKE